jgi:two-component system sensor histidine kinase/response regulator
MKATEAQTDLAPKILIVDDSPLNTKLLKFILDEAGYETVVASILKTNWFATQPYWPKI